MNKFRRTWRSLFLYSRNCQVVKIDISDPIKSCLFKVYSETEVWIQTQHQSVRSIEFNLIQKKSATPNDEIHVNVIPYPEKAWGEMTFS